MLEKWTPFRELDRMERRMRRVFEGAGVFPPLTPATDIYETEKEYVVELEVPGFEEKELEIEVSDHTLVVKGERTEETEKKEKALLLRERLERQFERRFELPFESDGEHVTADYGKGVLTLHVPKTTTAKPRKVEITAT
jgi:HSP20 family protein